VVTVTGWICLSLLPVGLHLSEVLSPKHVAGSCVVAVKGRIMLEVIPFIVVDLLDWKEITNLLLRVGIWRVYVASCILLCWSLPDG
jgi:hypothetical protein